MGQPAASDPVPGPVAYCAPGLKAWAEQILAVTDPGATVIEDEQMSGRSSILLIMSSMLPDWARDAGMRFEWAPDAGPGGPSLVPHPVVGESPE